MARKAEVGAALSIVRELMVLTQGISEADAGMDKLEMRVGSGASKIQMGR